VEISLISTLNWTQHNCSVFNLTPQLGINKHKTSIVEKSDLKISI
jgi:hypothetical protein